MENVSVRKEAKKNTALTPAIFTMKTVTEEMSQALDKENRDPKKSDKPMEKPVKVSHNLNCK